MLFVRNRVNTANMLTVLKTVSNQMSSFFKVQAKKAGNRARANYLHILMTKRSKSSVFVKTRFCIDAVTRKKKEKGITKLTRKWL